MTSVSERFLTEDIVTLWFNKYIGLCEKYQIPVELRMNGDETFLCSHENDEKIACIKGEDQPCIPGHEKAKEHITLVLFCNATGEKRFKPTVILPLKYPQEYCPQVMRKFNFAGQPNGWIDGPILKTLIEKVFIQELNDYRKEINKEDSYAMLILDNHSSRNILEEETIFEQHKLILLPLPPHSSALLQPLDLQPNGVFKQKYYQELRISTPKGPETALERRNRELQVASNALSVALADLTVQIAWRRTGLHPVDVGVPLRSNMVNPFYYKAPDPNKRKRKQKFGSGAILVNGNEMVNANPPEPPKKKPNTENRV